MESACIFEHWTLITSMVAETAHVKKKLKKKQKRKIFFPFLAETAQAKMKIKRNRKT